MVALSQVCDSPRVEWEDGRQVDFAKSKPSRSDLGTLASSISGDSVLCSGDTAYWTVDTIGGTWSTEDSTVVAVMPGIGTGTIVALSAGVAAITYPLDTAYAVKTVTVNPTPSAITGDSLNYVCVWYVVVLSDNSLGGTWSSSNPLFATVDSAGIVTGVGVGMDTVSYSYPSGCAVFRVLSVDDCPGRVPSVPTKADSIDVFPNPARVNLTITDDAGIQSLVIFDMVGQEVFRRFPNAPQLVVDIADLPSGTYVIKVNGIHVRRFSKLPAF